MDITVVQQNDACVSDTAYFSFIVRFKDPAGGVLDETDAPTASPGKSDAPTASPRETDAPTGLTNGMDDGDNG